MAIIGPGLDFADKSFGYDFYPTQTLQPFAVIDSLVRSGLAAGPESVEITTLDISARLNDHIKALQNRGKEGTPYLLHLPLELGLPWTPDLVAYWKRIGNSIGSPVRPGQPPAIGNRLEVRAIRIRPNVSKRVAAVDFNVVTDKWTEPLFDLVVATNVLVYYDALDQSLAFSRIESMLKPGGFFLTNNPIAEPPSSKLRAVGYVKTAYSRTPEYSDHVFWYRRL